MMFTRVRPAQPMHFEYFAAVPVVTRAAIGKPLLLRAAYSPSGTQHVFPLPFHVWQLLLNPATSVVAVSDKGIWPANV